MFYFKNAIWLVALALSLKASSSTLKKSMILHISFEYMKKILLEKPLDMIH